MYAYIIFFFLLLSVNASSISASLNGIPVLNGTNFEKWRDHITIVLGFMHLNYTLRTNKPSAITDKNTVEEKANYEKWERSNRMCLMVMKHTIPITIRGAMPDSAKSFLAEVVDQFTKLDKVEASMHLSK